MKLFDPGKEDGGSSSYFTWIFPEFWLFQYETILNRQDLATMMKERDTIHFGTGDPLQDNHLSFLQRCVPGSNWVRRAEYKQRTCLNGRWQMMCLQFLQTNCADVYSNHAICYVYFRYHRFWVNIDYSFHSLCQVGVPTSVTVPVWTSESRFSNSLVADSGERREKFTMICWIGSVFKHVRSMKRWICNLKKTYFWHHFHRFRSDATGQVRFSIEWSFNRFQNRRATSSLGPRSKMDDFSRPFSVAKEDPKFLFPKPIVGGSSAMQSFLVCLTYTCLQSIHSYFRSSQLTPMLYAKQDFR